MADPGDTRDRRNNSASRPAGLIELIQSSGAALTVGLAITFTFVIAVVGIPLSAGPDRATVASAAVTVIGTIAGAYFGLRVGGHGKEQAEEDRRQTQFLLERMAHDKERAEQDRRTAEQDRREAQLVIERVAAKVGERPTREAREEVRYEQRAEAPPG